jgi:hypothetical protein
MVPYPSLLKDIIDQAAKQKDSKKGPLKAVFDLDSTLFDVSHRITQIFHQFAKLSDIAEKFPEASKQLLALTPKATDWGVKKTLMRINFKSPGDDFLKTLVEYWKKHFFSSDFLHIDRPYPGATEFVQDLFKAGADILYLTGRDIPRMLKGTLASLRAHSFPLDENHANVFLKPSTQIADTDFKKEFFLKLDQSKGDVWFFENEPVNIKLVLDCCPHVKVVFVTTVHSEKNPEPGVHIPRISGFTL